MQQSERMALSTRSGFPHRDLIVLSAFIVVLGSLLLQGLTVGLLIRLLRIEPDRSLDIEISKLRVDAICAQRELLATLRRSGKISDDVFHRLTEKLDWAELQASPREELEMLDA